MNRDDAARAIEQFLLALGQEPTGELSQTPKLVAEAWCNDLLEGHAQDARAILSAGAIADPSTGLVVLRDLQVTTVCPHHLLPAHGVGDVAYLPGGHVAGLGAIARALRALTRRLTLQERAGVDMAKALIDALGARGALVRLRLTHTCLVARGARETTAVVDSLALEGSFGAGGEDRELALAALSS